GQTPSGDRWLADRLLLITGDGIATFASRGDPLPGREGFLFLGFESNRDRSFEFKDDIVLNDRRELAFGAQAIKCGSSLDTPSCSAASSKVQGLFLFSERRRITVALEGDSAPGVTGGRFQTFGDILLNNAGTVVFTSVIAKTDGSHAYGLFSFHQDSSRNIFLTQDSIRNIFTTDEAPSYIQSYGSWHPVLHDQEDITFLAYVA